MKNIFQFIGVAALVVLVYFVASKRAEYTITEIKDAENKVLIHENDSLRTVLDMYKRNEAIHINEVDSLHSVIDKNAIKLTEIKKSYEIEINRIDHIPADSLYMLFTEYAGK